MNNQVHPIPEAAAEDGRKVWETPTIEVLSAREAETGNGPNGDSLSSS